MNRLRYVQSPIAPNEWLCWCGQLYTSEPAAAECRHTRPRLPVIPKDVAFTLRTGYVLIEPGGQELGVRRPGDTSPWFGPVHLPATHRFEAAERRRAGIGAVIVLVFWCLLLAAVALVPAHSDDPGPIVTPPSVYPAPGPHGGFTTRPSVP